METCNVLLSTVDSFKNSMAAFETSIGKFSDNFDQVTQQLKQVCRGLTLDCSNEDFVLRPPLMICMENRS